MVSLFPPARIILAAIVIYGLCSPARADRPSDELYQYSTINALLGGLYDGDLTIGALAARGDTGLNVPGYHFHFISHNRRRGGHVLALVTDSGKILIDEIAEFSMERPGGPDFKKMDLTGTRRDAIHAVEKQQ